MEMNKETLEKMQQMRLQGMYYAFKTSLETLRMENDYRPVRLVAGKQ